MVSQEFGLILLEQGQAQQVMAKYLNLLMNYQYGMAIMVAPNIGKASSLLNENSERIRCVCVIQSTEISSDIVIKALSLQGKVPLFLIMPTKKLGIQRLACGNMTGVYFCAWEKAFGNSAASLQHMVGRPLEELGIGNLFQDMADTPYPVVQQRVERRLRNLNTLPTLPEIVMRIMRMVSDPQTTAEELDKVLCTDPAIVMKLLQVMRSPVFMGTAGRAGKRTLQEIITRLGLKKVGAIAQQVKMINSLVRPEESDFDLKRFWEHSVGSAIIADKIYTDRLVKIDGELEFNEYWIGALLHDVGKLVLGFFFWDWLQRVQNVRKEKKCSFRQAEAELGDVADHERVGRLMLLNADMGEEVVAAVGAHHDPGEQPGSLVCLVHLASNLANDLGLGCMPGEEARYDPRVLAKLGIAETQLDDLRDTLASEVVSEIKTVVEQCS